MSDSQDNTNGKCPVAHDSVTGHGGSESENPGIPSPEPKTGGRPRTNRDWWPNQLDLSVLHAHSPKGNPLAPDFKYAEAFKSLDVEAVKRDIVEVLTTSQDWWPADFGHYQPGQGPAAAVAGQGQVRPETVLGRPAGAGRQRGPGVDGLQDVRLRVRP
jgi:hypothetical protein